MNIRVQIGIYHDLPHVSDWILTLTQAIIILSFLIDDVDALAHTMLWFPNARQFLVIVRRFSD